MSLGVVTDNASEIDQIRAVESSIIVNFVENCVACIDENVTLN